MYFDTAYEKFVCSECTDREKFVRGCGLESYKGDKPPVAPIFKIDFGKKIINECPNSYCDWTYVGEAISAYKFHESGFLPEVWDFQRGCPASILDQTEFFHSMSQLVNATKNKAEAEAHKKISKGK